MEQKLYFKPGTWWIYRDSVTGITDSCVVQNAFKDVFTQIGDPTTYERLHIDIFAYRNNGKIDTFSSYMDMVGNSITYGCSAPVAAVLGSVYATVTYPFAGAPLTLNGTTYNNVVTTFSNTLFYVHDHPTVSISKPSYINDEVGIIKCYVPHTADSVFDVRELVRYNIVR